MSGKDLERGFYHIINKNERHGEAILRRWIWPEFGTVVIQKHVPQNLYPEYIADTFWKYDTVAKMLLVK